MVENHQLRGLMMKWLIFEAYSQKNKFLDDLQAYLATIKGALTQE